MKCIDREFEKVKCTTERKEGWTDDSSPARLGTFAKENSSNGVLQSSMFYLHTSFDIYYACLCFWIKNGWFDQLWRRDSVPSGLHHHRYLVKGVSEEEGLLYHLRSIVPMVQVVNILGLLSLASLFFRVYEYTALDLEEYRPECTKFRFLNITKKWNACAAKNLYEHHTKK